MKRGSAMVGLAGILCLLAGCTSMDFAGILSAQRDGETGEYVVAGSVQAVAEASVRSLSRLGIKTHISPVGETIHVTAQTNNGGRFVLVFVRDRDRDVERTRIRLHWLDRRGDAFDLGILAETMESEKG